MQLLHFSCFDIEDGTGLYQTTQPNNLISSTCIILVQLQAAGSCCSQRYHSSIKVYGSKVVMPQKVNSEIFLTWCKCKPPVKIDAFAKKIGFTSVYKNLKRFSLFCQLFFSCTLLFKVVCFLCFYVMREFYRFLNRGKAN